MKTMIARLFDRFNSKTIEREVEDELHFHLALLTEKHLRQGMPLEKAEDEALKRFGNVERIKNQCVEINKRIRPSMRVLKYFLIAVSLGGVLVRVFSAGIYGKQIGSMLIVITGLSSLLIYIRGLRPLSFIPEVENSSPLGLGNNKQTSFAANDQREFTPVERVIADD